MTLPDRRQTRPPTALERRRWLWARGLCLRLGRHFGQRFVEGLGTPPLVQSSPLPWKEDLDDDRAQKTGTAGPG